MSIEVISHKVHIAKKNYHDDANCEFDEWIDGGCNLSENSKVSFADYRVIVAHKNSTLDKRNFVNIGDNYVRQFNKIDGDSYTFRTKSYIYDLMNKYDLYDNDI